MRRNPSIRWALACGLLAFMAQAQAQTAPGWTGTWKGVKGALLSVMESGGSMDVWGTDEASVFRLSCVVNQKDPAQANCVGEGANHRRGTRFTYRNKLRLSASGITEEWEAQEYLGGAEGRETFTRVATAK